MTTLTEAARLYLADIDVLEEARSELDDYFKETWDAFLATIRPPSKPTFEHAGRSWTGSAVGTGRQLTFASPGVLLKLAVCDPLASTDPRHFPVWIWCTKADHGRIKRADGVARLVAAAAERGLSLDFSEVVTLCAQDVSADQDQAVIVAALAAHLRSFAEHAVALQAVLEALPGWVPDEPSTR